MANPQDTANRGSRSGTPRWVMGLLLVSLMANMIVVGAAAGRMWVHQGGHGWFDRHGHRGGMRGFLREVAEPRRSELAEMIRANRAGMREERQKVHELRKAVREVMVREPFDKAALVAALGAMNTARQAVADRFAATLSDLLERMTPEERKAFVDKELRRHGRHHGGKHDDKL
ncbi:MAG TPA: periplasmic heavy metal sensor [Hyphomicrobiaceae bacterium]|nr:periplasmic heavy metal sensor [Hyphomicrobiaceae bacterium]